MGDSETLRLLKAGKVVGLELCLLESIEELPDNAGKEVEYMIKYSMLSPKLETEEVLYLASPEKLGNGHPVHETYNLNIFSKEPIKAELPATEQIIIMYAALEKLASIDPRIKGIDAKPIAIIEKIGGREFNLESLQECYKFVKKEMQTLSYR